MRCVGVTNAGCRCKLGATVDGLCITHFMKKNFVVKKYCKFCQEIVKVGSHVWSCPFCSHNLSLRYAKC